MFTYTKIKKVSQLSRYTILKWYSKDKNQPFPSRSRTKVENRLKFLFLLKAFIKPFEPPQRSVEIKI